MTLHFSLSAVFLLATTSLAAGQNASFVPPADETAPQAPVLATPDVGSTGNGLQAQTATGTDLNTALPALPTAVEMSATGTPAPTTRPARPTSGTVTSNATGPAVPVSTTADPQQTGASSAPSALASDAATPVAAVARPSVQPLFHLEGMRLLAEGTSGKALTFLRDGGPSIWAIAALSVATLALILWKIWRLALIGAWSHGKASKAVLAYEAGDSAVAMAIVEGRIGIRSKVVSAGLAALRDLPEDRAREETARIAKKHLAQAGNGLGALELIATIAPLLGLLGTVLGMIAAFQALQQAGSKADPALLAGGIWEALLTTAAGMTVAIPASAALTWFESVISRIRQDIEDSATRLFVAVPPQDLPIAAE